MCHFCTPLIDCIGLSSLVYVSLVLIIFLMLFTLQKLVRPKVGKFYMPSIWLNIIQA